LVADNPINERFTFEGGSYVDYRFTAPDPLDIARGLQLPGQVPQRVRALVDEWRLEHGSDDPAAMVQAALRYFAEESFYYTLTPSVTQGDPTEAFLFDTRQGFCEHFASSFVMLMRLAGVPARLVVGYQGGTENPHAGHWVIRQSDAHAWAEVWLDGRGWWRVDPTAAVAPERVLQSINPGLSVEEERVVFHIDSDSLIGSLLREGNWLVDAIDIGWHRWVVGYTSQRQAGLLKDLGLEFLDGYKQGMAMVIGCFAATGLIVLFLRAPFRRERDPVRQAWQRFREKLQRKGTETPVWMGPQDLAALAGKRHPGQKQDIDFISRLYTQLRFGRSTPRHYRNLLQRKVRSLRLDKASEPQSG
jgi:transglutaminase-like putative cysteine protease